MAAAAEHDHQPPGAAIAPARPVSLWWLDPVVVVIALVVPTFLAALWYSPQHYRAAWRTAKWVGWDTAWLVGPAAAALVLGCVVGAALVRRGPHAPHGPDGPHGQASWPVLAPSTEAVLQRAFPVLVRITFVAYALWAVALLARGFTPAGLLDL